MLLSFLVSFLVWAPYYGGLVIVVLVSSYGGLMLLSFSSMLVSLFSFSRMGVSSSLLLCPRMGVVIVSSDAVLSFCCRVLCFLFSRLFPFRFFFRPFFVSFPLFFARVTLFSVSRRQERRFWKSLDPSPSRFLHPPCLRTRPGFNSRAPNITRFLRWKNWGG